MLVISMGGVRTTTAVDDICSPWVSRRVGLGLHQTAARSVAVAPVGGHGPAHGPGPPLGRGPAMLGVWIRGGLILRGHSRGCCSSIIHLGWTWSATSPTPVSGFKAHTVASLTAGPLVRRGAVGVAEARGIAEVAGVLRTVWAAAAGVHRYVRTGSGSLTLYKYE